jgi:hypothetical protein
MTGIAPRRALALGVVAVLLALAAIPVTTAAAATEWHHESQAIPQGERVEVVARNRAKPFKLFFKRPKLVTETTECQVTGKEAFWNEGEVGRNETTELAFSCSAALCGAVTVTPLLPWPVSTLLPPPTEKYLPVEWPNTSIDFTCGGTDYGAFSATLFPQSGDGDSQVKDEYDSYLNFAAGSILRGSGGRITVQGHLVLGYFVGKRKLDNITGHAR